jgi:hypothetical protein
MSDAVEPIQGDRVDDGKAKNNGGKCQFSDHDVTCSWLVSGPSGAAAI